MNRSLALPVLLLCCTCSGFLAPTQFAQGQGGKKPLLPPDAVWIFRWDTKIDGVLRKPETHTMKMSVRNNNITGSMSDDSSRWSGEIVAGKSVAVTLTQRGQKGYVAFHAGKVVKAGHIV